MFLDELDRMERDELLTLLKVIRGVSTLPNLSFVCALDLDKVMRVVLSKKSQEPLSPDDRKYFEKFFPIIQPVSSLTSDALRTAAIDRMVSTFQRANWFTDSIEKSAFEKKLSAAWDELLSPFCSNLRAIGLLANSVSAVAPLLRREVDPFDLTLVEVLHRFSPAVYDLISDNSPVLTGGPSLSKGGMFLTDPEMDSLKKKFSEALRKEAGEEEEKVASIVNALFPTHFAKLEGLRRRDRFSFVINQEGFQEKLADKSKHIENPDLFPAYFRYELPKAMFSSVEIEEFLAQFAAAKTEQERDACFGDEIGDLEKESLKRRDFFQKLSDNAASLTPDVRLALLGTLMRFADRISYDLFVGLGESGHVIRTVLRVAKAIPFAERKDVLARCIRAASDDTMALRILLFTDPERNTDIRLHFADLYPHFVARMRERYGESVDASKVDLSSSDKDAFRIWGNPGKFKSEVVVDPLDIEFQREFWLGYIGQSRERLLEVFEKIFMPRGIYISDPTPFVESMIPVKDLRELDQTLQPLEAPADEQDREQDWLRRFLNGDFAKGIDVSELEWPRSNPAGAGE